MSALQQVASNVSDQIKRTAGSVSNQVQRVTNKLLPPRKREQVAKDIQIFANRNPKLAIFLAIQATLTAIPLILFILFAISTCLISLSTCLLLAVTTAFIYTFFCVVIGLFFLAPTLFIASFAATCAFLWGLAMYMVLRRFNDGEGPAKKGTKVGDKLHGLTGGRLEWLDGKEIGKGQHGSTTDGNGTHEVQVQSGDEKWRVPDGNGCEDGKAGSNVARHGVDEYVNGNGEWETKWSKGTQKKQLDLAKEFDIKVDTIES